MEGIVSTTITPAAISTHAYWFRSSTLRANVTREVTTGSHVVGGNTSATPDYVVEAYEGPLRTTFLGLFTFAAFAGNLLLILAVAQNRTLRRTGLNVHLIGMAAANCLFCAVDMPLMIASSVAAEWEYGSTACAIFAYLHVVSSVEYVLGMVCLAVNRLSVVKLSRGWSGISPSDFVPAAALTVSCWLIALSVGVPLLTGTVPVAWYPHRYMCDIGVGSDAAFAYGAAVYASVYALPSLLVVLLLTLTASTMLRDRNNSPRPRDRRARGRGDERGLRDDGLEGQSQPNSSRGSGRGGGRHIDPHGARGSVFVLLVFVLWILLAVPLIALSSTEVYLHSMTAVGLPARSEHVLSIVFTWLACAHCTVLPFAAFIWCRDIWDNFKEVLAWRKSVAAVGIARSGGGSSVLTAGANQVGSTNPSVSSVERFPTRFKVPVLIATETGLHVHDDANNNAHADPATERTNEGDRESDAAGEHGSRQNRFIYADLTTRSYEITIERPATRSGTLASGSDLTDDADEVADLSRYSDHPATAKELFANGVGAAGRAGALSSFVDGGSASAAPGQTNSLSTDSGVGSAAGSVSRQGRKSKGRVRTRGPLLVRTGSQPPAEADEKGGGGEPLPRIPLTLGAGWAPWLTPAHVDHNNASVGYEPSGLGGRDFSYRGFRTTALAKAVTEIEAERLGRYGPTSDWAASEEQLPSLASAAPARKRKRKKKHSKQASVTSEPAYAAALPAYNDDPDSISLPLRPARLAPLAPPSLPICAAAPADADAPYSVSLPIPGPKAANLSETPL